MINSLDIKTKHHCPGSISLSSFHARKNFSWNSFHGSEKRVVRIPSSIGAGPSIWRSILAVPRQVNELVPDYRRHDRQVWESLLRAGKEGILRAEGLCFLEGQRTQSTRNLSKIAFLLLMLLLFLSHFFFMFGRVRYSHNFVSKLFFLVLKFFFYDAVALFIVPSAPAKVGW